MRANRADENGKQNQWQHFTQAAPVFTGDRTQQIARHEHIHGHGQTELGLGSRCSNMLLGDSTEFGHKHILGFSADLAAGIDDLHHDKSQRDRDGHVGDEERKGAASERAEFVELAKLGYATGQGGEHQGDDHEEQHAQKHLSQWVEDVVRHLLHKGEEWRIIVADAERNDARDGAIYESF